MKNCYVLLFFLFVIDTSVLGGSRGEWDIGGKVSGVKNGNEYGIKTGIKCEYHFHSFFTWRTDLEAFAHGEALSRIDVSIPSNVLWYPFKPDAPLSPYIGPGLTFNHTWNNRNTLGINALAGVNLQIMKGKVFGVEIKYTVPFLPRPAPGHVELGLTGAWEIEF
jgi:hypothetical protein